MQTIIEGLARLTAPPEGTVWIGPFEQLAGAGYALLTAHRLGIGTRGRRINYHDEVRRTVIPTLVAHLKDGSAAAPMVTKWLAGFYFNAAKQRLVWTDERLLRGFVATGCSGCSWRSGYVGGDMPKVVELANLCVDHAMACRKKQLIHTAQLIRAHDLSGPLMLLRRGVNARKHSLYPELQHTIEGRVPETQQVRFARDVFDLLVEAYAELLQWCPASRRT
jgi:hypothetical protein